MILLRRLVLVLFLGSLLLAGPAASLEQARESVEGPPPAVVFAGEEIDVSGVGLSGGGVMGNDSVVLTGLRGDAEGTVEPIDDPRDADFGQFATGTYDVDGDEHPEFAVTRPRITELTVRLDNGANVTNGQIPTGRTVTVDVEFNFDSADGVRIKLFDESGTDITPSVTDDQIVAESGGSVTLDLADERAGRYRIIAEKRGDDDNRRQVTLNVGSSALSVDLDRTSVIQGERVTATVLGTPGEQAHVRIDERYLATPESTVENAQQVFRRTGDVTSIVGDPSRGVVAAVVELDSKGRAQVQIDTTYLDTGTAAIDVGPGEDLAARVEDDADLRISERTITATVPRVITIGDKYTITGSAPEAEAVKAYAYVDGRWLPLFEDGGRNRYAEEPVKIDGRFELTIDSSRVINYPGSYRVGIVADAIDRYASDRELSSGEFGDLTTATTTVRTHAGGLTATQSRGVVATDSGDEVVIYGTAFGQGDSLHLYLVGPRGSLQVAETVSVDNDGEFDERLEDFDTTGAYRVFVIGQGRDGRFHGDSTPSTIRNRLRGSEEPSQVVAIIRDAYQGAGSDDRIVELSVRAESPQVSIDPIGVDDQIPAPSGLVTIRGTSNREPGTDVEVSIVDRREGSVVTTTQTSVRTDGEWAVTVDLSGLSSGEYRVEADDGRATSSRALAIVEPTPTATPTPEDTPSERPSPTRTPSPRQPTTPTETTEMRSLPRETPTTPTPTTTRAEGPGPGSVVVALVLLVALACRVYGRANQQ